MKKHKTHILKLEKDDPNKGVEFEIEFQLSPTVVQRYKRMKKLVNQTMKTVKQQDYPKTPKIISRS